MYVIMRNICFLGFKPVPLRKFRPIQEDYTGVNKNSLRNERPCFTSSQRGFDQLRSSEIYFCHDWVESKLRRKT